MAQLYTELDHQGTVQGSVAVRAAADSLGRGAFAGMLEEEEEELVASINAALARLVDAVAGGHPERVVPLPSAIIGALGGAELVMRAEIMAGRGERLASLLPGFVFVVTIPFAGEEEALRLSRRTGELLDGSGRT